MRDWLTNDLYWKAFSIFMAVGIWLTVHKFSEEGAPTPGLLSVENTFTNVPVVAVSGTADVHGVHIEPDLVTVDISGSPDTMAAFDSDRLHAFVDLTGVNSAHEMIRHVDVAAPPRVTILTITPPTVTVTTPK